MLMVQERLKTPLSVQNRHFGSWTSCRTENHLGSTAAVINDKGELIEATMYTAYGEQIPLMVLPGTEAAAREKFTGKEFDQEGAQYDAQGNKTSVGIDAYHFGYRTYDPEIGMWLQPDPAMHDFNLYSYCSGNPISRIDPDGREPITIILAAIVGHLYLSYRNYQAGMSVEDAINPFRTEWYTGDKDKPGSGAFNNLPPIEAGYDSEKGGYVGGGGNRSYPGWENGIDLATSQAMNDFNAKANVPAPSVDVSFSLFQLPSSRPTRLTFGNLPLIIPASSSGMYAQAGANDAKSYASQFGVAQDRTFVSPQYFEKDYCGNYILNVPEYKWGGKCGPCYTHDSMTSQVRTETQRYTTDSIFRQNMYQRSSNWFDSTVADIYYFGVRVGGWTSTLRK